MSEKKSLESKIERVLTNADFWIEPMREWIETAVSICSIDEKTEHSEIARAFRQIEGLNLKMKNKKVVAECDAKSHPPQKNSWQALRATSEKTARMGGNFRICSDLVRMKGLSTAGSLLRLLEAKIASLLLFLYCATRPFTLASAEAVAVKVQITP